MNRRSVLAGALALAATPRVGGAWADADDLSQYPGRIEANDSMCPVQVFLDGEPISCFWVEPSTGRASVNLQPPHCEYRLSGESEWHAKPVPRQWRDPSGKIVPAVDMRIARREIHVAPERLAVKRLRKDQPCHQCKPDG